MVCAKVSSFGFFLILLLLASCTYTPNDKFVNPIEKPPSTISASINVANLTLSDPFPLNFNTRFELKIDSANKPIINYAVSVDDAFVETTYQNKVLSFSLSPAAYSDGKHTVKISIRIDTQSGSLANKAGLEYYLVEKSFSILIDKVLPTPTKPISISMENGHLVIQWEKFAKSNFKYIISHIAPDNSSGNGSYLMGDTTIADPSITKFIDYGYVGGKISYGVAITNGSNYNPVRVGSMDFDFDPLKQVVSVTDDFVELITWDKTLLNSLNVTVQATGIHWTKTVDMDKGMVYGDTLALGQFDIIGLKIQRKGFPTYRYFASIPFSPKYNLAYYKSIQMYKNNQAFTSTQDNVVRLNLLNKKKEDSLSNHFNGNSLTSIGQMVLSNDGNSGVVVNGINAGIYLFNPSDFTGLSLIDFHLLFDYAYEYVSTNRVSSISNNQFVGLNYSYTTLRVAGIGDLRTGKMLWTDTTNLDAPVLSADGNYFAVNNATKTKGLIYKYQNGKWEFSGNVPSGKYYFRNNSTSELIVTNSSFNVYDLTKSLVNNNYPLVRSYNLPSGVEIGNLGYDEVAQQVYIQIIDRSDFTPISILRIYDVQDFKLKGSGKAVLTPITQHYYSNGYHFVPGYYSKIR